MTAPFKPFKGIAIGAAGRPWTYTLVTQARTCRRCNLDNGYVWGLLRGLTEAIEAGYPVKFELLSTCIYPRSSVDYAMQLLGAPMTEGYADAKAPGTDRPETYYFTRAGHGEAPTVRLALHLLPSMAGGGRGRWWLALKVEGEGNWHVDDSPGWNAIESSHTFMPLLDRAYRILGVP